MVFKWIEWKRRTSSLPLHPVIRLGIRELWSDNNWIISGCNDSEDISAEIFQSSLYIKKKYNIGTAESVNCDITVNQTVALQSLDPNELNICFPKALRVRIYDFYFTFAFAFFFFPELLRIKSIGICCNIQPVMFNIKGDCIITQKLPLKIQKLNCGLLLSEATRLHMFLKFILNLFKPCTPFWGPSNLF